MDGRILLLWIIIAITLESDFLNGFHDAAKSIAAIAQGTYSSGWRIVKTLAMAFTELQRICGGG